MAGKLQKDWVEPLIMRVAGGIIVVFSGYGLYSTLLPSFSWIIVLMKLVSKSRTLLGSYPSLLPLPPWRSRLAKSNEVWSLSCIGLNSRCSSPGPLTVLIEDNSLFHRIKEDFIFTCPWIWYLSCNLRCQNPFADMYRANIALLQLSFLIYAQV